MSKGKTVLAVREGDEIVIRMPVDRLIEIVARAHDVTIAYPRTFVAEIQTNMNKMLGNDLSVIEDYFVQEALFRLEDGLTSMVPNSEAPFTVN
jgi:hypothetical protein